MTDGPNEIVERIPVSPETVTVLGYRVKASDPMWAGLDFTGAEPRQQASIMLMLCGAGAPEDIHLNVPWMHPDDRARFPDEKDDGCRYRVRPRMKAGKRWKGRKIVSVAFERWDGEWFLALTYAASKALIGTKAAEG